ncbi:MAG TPA: plastocyanin/azurin family copper-binding protein [Gaiellaceae bacterium]|nr:plastocyanin/azurin family copper-binding protein [Gaiellaceae bacterium]
MRRALVVLAAALATLAVAWPASGAPTAGGVTVFAGPPLAKPAVAHSDALAFFPRAVTIHAGDTVTWHVLGFHTVTFSGRYRPYPFVTPTGKQPLVKDATGAPFWWAGHAPVLDISPLTLLQQGGASISSPAQVRSSGLIRVIAAPPNTAPQPYSLTFTVPGVYHYRCAVHPGMRGVVVVVPASKPVPSAAQELAAAQSAVKRAVVDMHALSKTRAAGALRVLVGTGHNSTGAELTSFFPARLSVHVGSTVRFVNHDQTDIHTVTFGPEKLRSAIEAGFAAPRGHEVILNALGALPSEPPGTRATYDGASHGNGYLSSGILQPQGAPSVAGTKSFAVTFTKAGVYHYECVVHKNMDGTIVVR